jgi:hypothetical protein
MSPVSGSCAAAMPDQANDGYGPGASMVDLEVSAGHVAPPQGGLEPNLPNAALCRDVRFHKPTRNSQVFSSRQIFASLIFHMRVSYEPKGHF